MNDLRIRSSAQIYPPRSIRALAVVGGAALFAASGCNAIMNSWLDPSTVGNFSRTATNEIRTSLSLADSPAGVPGSTYPTPDDLRIVVEDYPLSAGDTLNLEINELRQRGQAFQAQVQVTTAGYVNLPVVGRVQAAGLTVPELQDVIAESLRQKSVLVEPDVTINPLFLQKATYSIFGVGVSASNNAPLRAGIFPIRRPDLKLLDAINQVGGLNEFVTEVYIFRYDEPTAEPDVPKQIQRASQEVRPPKPAVEEKKPASPEPENAHEPKAAREGESKQREADYNELLRAAEGDTERPVPGKKEASPEEALSPEPPPPYIFSNGQFIPNPEYRGSPRSGETESAASPTFDTVTPAVNWARLAGETSFRVIVIPAEPLRNGDPQLNIYIRAGDVIRIASGEIGVYYVMGQVNRVGVFTFNSEQVTLKQAIAAAGGLSGLAWPDRCTIYRKLGQSDQMIQVNLDRIFGGQEADFYVRRGDIVNVGTRPFAPFLQRIRAFTLPNPLNTVGYSYTYARNFADIDSYAVKQNPANEPKKFPNLFP